MTSPWVPAFAGMTGRTQGNDWDNSPHATEGCSYFCQKAFWTCLELIHLFGSTQPAHPADTTSDKPKARPEMLAQRRRRSEARLLRHDFDGGIAAFQHPLRMCQRCASSHCLKEVPVACRKRRVKLRRLDHDVRRAQGCKVELNGDAETGRCAQRALVDRTRPHLESRHPASVGAITKNQGWHGQVERRNAVEGNDGNLRADCVLFGPIISNIVFRATVPSWTME
jgi:hypothetical protein